MNAKQAARARGRGLAGECPRGKTYPQTPAERDLGIRVTAGLSYPDTSQRPASAAPAGTSTFAAPPRRADVPAGVAGPAERAV